MRPRDMRLQLDKCISNLILVRALDDLCTSFGWPKTTWGAADTAGFTRDFHESSIQPTSTRKWGQFKNVREKM